MEVIAEGVETEEQCRQLKALGCEYGQGYLFSRPVNGDCAQRLLAEDTQRHLTLNTKLIPDSDDVLLSTYQM